MDFIAYTTGNSVSRVLNLAFLLIYYSCGRFAKIGATLTSRLRRFTDFRSLIDKGKLSFSTNVASHHLKSFLYV